jgi:hypothetical protein
VATRPRRRRWSLNPQLVLLPPRPVSLPPPKSHAQPAPKSVVQTLMQLVLHLWGGMLPTMLRAFVGTVFPSHLGSPYGIVGRPSPVVIRRPGLVELQGLLVILSRMQSRCGSEAALVVVHGWCQSLHSGFGRSVVGLRESGLVCSQANWEERLELVARWRPNL